MNNSSRPAVASSAAIAKIKEARAAGHHLTFNPGHMSRGGLPVIASYMPGQYEHIDILADGTTDDDFTGEDSGIEAAIERANDEWASNQQWKEDQGRGWGGR